MNTPYTGGCACGAIRYSISAEPAVMNDCQCRQCQRDSDRKLGRSGRSALVVLPFTIRLPRLAGGSSNAKHSGT